MRLIEQEEPGKETEEKLKTVGSAHWDRKHHWVHYGPKMSRVDPKAQCWRDEILGGGDRGSRSEISPEMLAELQKSLKKK